MWTKNFQMFKLDLKRQRNQRSSCQHPIDHQKSNKSSKKNLLLLYWLCQSLFVDHNKLWKILQEMGIPEMGIGVTCLLRNLYAGQEATVRTGHGTTDSFQIGKEYINAVYCHTAYLTYMQSKSWETLGWMKHILESRLPEEISISSDMQMIPPLWQKVKKNLESLDESERGEWKSWLKA